MEYKPWFILILYENFNQKGPLQIFPCKQNTQYLVIDAVMRPFCDMDDCLVTPYNSLW
jgi:hypothetical protein